MAYAMLQASVQIKDSNKEFLYELNLPASKTKIASAVTKMLFDHFMSLNSERSHGLTSPGFYAEAARGITAEYTDDGIEVSTSRVGIRLRFLGSGGLPGGVVRPVKAKYLTIPAIAEAYGKPAGYFGGLRFVKFGTAPDAPAALIERGVKSATVAKTGKRVRNAYKNAGTQGAFEHRVFYWLKKETRHKPDDSVLPSVEAVEAVVEKAAEEYINTIKE